MRKRLRKKRRIAEFKQLGFIVSFQLDQALPLAVVGTLLDRFILEAMEANGLTGGGGSGGGGQWRFFLNPRRYRNATDNDRRLAERWLLAESGIAAFEIGDLEDASSWPGRP